MATLTKIEKKNLEAAADRLDQSLDAIESAKTLIDRLLGDPDEPEESDEPESDSDAGEDEVDAAVRRRREKKKAASEPEKKTSRKKTSRKKKPEVNVDMVRDALMFVIEKDDDGPDECAAILEDHGVEKVSELKDEDYKSVYDACVERGYEPEAD